MDKTTPKAVQDTHITLQWFIQKLDKFPRNHRFTLGERIENRLIEILELLIQASYQRTGKEHSLSQANLQIEVVRHLWRLAYELKVISMKNYHYGSKLLFELGQQVGGWQKYTKK